MNRKFLEAIEIIFTIITIILAIAAIIMIVMKLLSYSPTETTITFSIIGILIALQTIIIGILFQIKGDIGGLREFQRGSVEFQKQTIEKIKDIEDRL